MAEAGRGGKWTVVETRSRILEAAAQVMRERGLARTTTKEIARRAELSEGALYRHFASKEDLFLDVLRERMPSFVTTVMSLGERVGREPIPDVLTDVAMRAIAFYYETAAMTGSLFAEPDLLARHQDYLRQQGVGPHRALEAVAAYLAAEQAAGRIAAGTRPDAVAALLLGGCLQRAYFRAFLGDAPDPEADTELVAGMVATIWQGIAPRDA